MVKVLIEFCEFLLSCAPLLTSLAGLTVLFIVLARSIKKHPAVYYIAFSIPFILVAIPTILRWCGIESFSFTRVPVLGQILRDYIHMGTFGHPLLIIIMYIGALDMRTQGVKKLMSIRKEMSIISGFAVFTHSLIRVANNFPNSLRFFTNNAEYLENAKVASVTGAGISSFSFVLGIIMLVIFIPLWITSFDAVHKRMGTIKWRKLQKWSYVLYATLFIHAMGIQVGSMLTPRGGGQPRHAADVTVVAQQSSNTHDRQPEAAGQATANPHGGPTASQAEGERQTAQPARSSGSRAQAKGFSDINVSAKAKQYIHVVSLILIYGSYLYLRLRKARKNAKKRTGHTEPNA